MGPQAGPQLLTLHGMAAVVAMADAIGAFNCAQSHGDAGANNRQTIPSL
jgi:hypothetical protein